MINRVGYAFSPGGVVAAKSDAARAAVELLAAGANAADAAVAAAAALAVVDPANCGIGGYGGFAVIDRGDGGAVLEVDFNTRVPAGFRPDWRTGKGRPGILVTPPAVVAGLCAIQRELGRAEPEEVWAPAIRLARQGIAISEDLSHALNWAAKSHRGLNDAFKSVFFPGGVPLKTGETLRQPDLAASLERIASSGVDAMRRGTLVDTICAAVGECGGSLGEKDFRSLGATVAPASSVRFGRAEVWVPAPDHCGGRLLLDALSALDTDVIGESRGETYVRALTAALGEAYRSRSEIYLSGRHQSQTSHLSVADSDGMVVSMTFTHGPTWFGSGILAGDSGILLNAGAHLLMQRRADGEAEAVPYLCPIILRYQGARYGIGSPGGWRIPAIVLQSVLDLVHYKVPLESLFTRPRVSVHLDGAPEAEKGLVLKDMSLRQISADEYFGPAGAIAFTPEGVTGATDPRFESFFFRAT